MQSMGVRGEQSWAKMIKRIVQHTKHIRKKWCWPIDGVAHILRPNLKFLGVEARFEFQLKSQIAISDYFSTSYFQIN